MCRKNIDEEKWDMPVIEMKTNTAVTVEQKEKIAAGFTKVFEAVGEAEVSQNLLVEIDGDRWIDFRGDAGQPAALVTIHPGPMTPEKDYAGIVAGFFKTVKDVLPDIPKERIYMTVSNISLWGWNGALL